MKNVSERDFEQAIVFLSSRYRSSTNPKPVLLHSIRVGLMLCQLGYKKEIVLAGFLHDVIEDMHVTKEEIQKHFGSHVADFVASVSFNPNIKDKTKRYKEQMSRASSVGKDALLVETADILDNSEYFFLATDEDRKVLLEKYAYFLKISRSLLSEETVWKKLLRRVRHFQ
ncbi:MAG TPA: HD domain-containing protein [Patescibacteria group bacterium]|nr:HD domain-containing protein [Patescibacteria group bacterium]